MMAAIRAAELGFCVTLFERNERVGKKLLATGNGKCNLTNLSFSSSCYYSSKSWEVEKYIKSIEPSVLITIMEQLGLMVKSKNGYVYPYCEQAAVVLDILRQHLERTGVEIKLAAKVDAIQPIKERAFVVRYQDKEEVFHKVIIACGGKAAPKTGSDGNGFLMLEALGIQVNPLYPSLVQLCCKESFFKQIGGIRCEAEMRMNIDNGSEIQHFVERGELQITEYGISGIPVFQFSRWAAMSISPKYKITVDIDFVPGMDSNSWMDFCKNRRMQYLHRTVEEMLLGLLHKKLTVVFCKRAGIKALDKVGDIQEKKLCQLFSLMKNFTVEVVGTKSFDNAQVTAGGVDLSEITENFEIKKIPGMYVTGEMIDIDGRCGGYNLHFAFLSGYMAASSLQIKDKDNE